MDFALGETSTTQLVAYDQDQNDSDSENDMKHDTTWGSVFDLSKEFHEHRFDWLQDRDQASGVCVLLDQIMPPNPSGQSTHFFSPIAGDVPSEQDQVNDDCKTTVGSGKDMPKNEGTATIGTGILFVNFMVIAFYGPL